MFAKIQRKYMAKMIFFAILCGLFVAVAIEWTVQNVSRLVQARTGEPIDLNSLTASQIQNGLFVEGEIGAPIDYYTYEAKYTKIPRRKYLIRVGEEVYMGLSCSDDTLSTVKENMQIVLDAKKGNNPYLLKDIQPVKVRGVIKRLSFRSQIQLYQYISSTNLTEEEKGRFLDYELVEAPDGDVTFSDLIVDVTLILLFMFLGVNCIVRGVKRRNIRDLKEYCEAQGDLEYGLFRMEEFYENGTPQQGLRLDDEFFLMIAGTKVYFTPTAEILWVYPYVARRGFYVLDKNKYAIKVRKADGSGLKIPVNSRQDMDEMMKHISSRIPYVILGHNREIGERYLYRRREMIRVVEQRRREYLGI